MTAATASDGTSQPHGTTVRSFVAAGSTPEYQEKRDTDARVSIALILVVSYVVLLAASIVIPLVLAHTTTALSQQSLSTIQDLIAPITAAVGSVGGVLGFVLGYYFKAQEDKKTG